MQHEGHFQKIAMFSAQIREVIKKKMGAADLNSDDFFRDLMA